MSRVFKYLFELLPEAAQQFIKSHWPEAERFLICGPTLVGWVIGAWRYQPGEDGFRVAVQAFAVFVIYVLLLVANHAVALLNLFGYQDFPYFADAGLACVYIALSLWQYFAWRAGKPVILSQLDRALAPLSSR